MIDYNKQLVSILSPILPTHYEMTLHSGLKTPCISYMEVNNYTVADDNYQGYSRLTFHVKVWAKNIAEIQKYSLKVDEALRPHGFRRISSGELYDNNSSMIQKIMTYEVLSFEVY